MKRHTITVWEIDGVRYATKAEAARAEAIQHLDQLLEKAGLGQLRVGEVSTDVFRDFLLGAGWALPNILSAILRAGTTENPDADRPRILD